MVMLVFSLTAVSEKTNITINVPLKFINEETCIGVKQQGGMISHLKNEIELTCNAQNLPEFIEIDMKDLEIGSNVMQSQIILPEGVSLSTNILNNQDQPVASVNVTSNIYTRNWLVLIVKNVST